MTLEQPPFVERPDQHKPVGDELYCFRDATRLCNASCTAFLGMGEEATEVRDGQPVPLPGGASRCSILAAQHRSGKHLVIIAQQLAAFVKIETTRDADRRSGR